jgi:hypothetical protein
LRPAFPLRLRQHQTEANLEPHTPHEEQEGT